MSEITPKTTKLISIVCKDIIEGGGDQLRNELGYVYSKVSDTSDALRATTDGTLVEGTQFSYTPVDGTSTAIRDMRGRYVIRASTRSPYIDKLEVNPYRIRKYSEATILPNYVIPLRLYANEASTQGDKFWSVFFNGGTFSQNHYNSLINDSDVFYSEAINYRLPYHIQYSKKLENLQAEKNAEVTCVYNTYYPVYENFSSGLESVLMIPSYYGYQGLWMSDLDYTVDSSASTIKRFQYLYSLHGKAFVNYLIGSSLGKDPTTLFKAWYRDLAIAIDYGSDYAKLIEDIERIVEISTSYSVSNFINFLYDYVVNRYPGLNGDDIERNKKKQENVILDNYYLRSMRHYTTIGMEKMFPYYVTIDIPIEKTSMDGAEASLSGPRFNETPSDLEYLPIVTRTLIKHAGASKFLEMLKAAHHKELTDLSFKEKVFETQTMTTAGYNEIESAYELSMRDYAAGQLTTDVNSLTTTTTATELNVDSAITEQKYRTIDIIELLSSAYNQSSGSTDNYFFAGSIPSSDETGAYIDRHSISSNSSVDRMTLATSCAKSIRELVEYMEEYYDDLVSDLPSSVPAESLSSEIGSATDVTEKILQPILNYRETVAYRVCKKSRFSKKEIQNFWIFANQESEVEIPTIIDTQVKYDHEYTYTIYAYVAYLGHKYKYENFKLTKQIATIELDPDAYGAESYCLQFYDPKTSQFASQEFFEGRGVETFLDPEKAISESTAGINTSILAQKNEFSTNQQEISIFPQLADVNLIIEPCLKLIEIPLMTKDIRVTDNPGNHLMVEPYQYIDDSNRIGFDTKYEGFLPYPYPVCISDHDKKLKQDYLRTYSLIDGENVSKKSVSLERYIEIYRIEQVPKSIESFDGALIRTIDLKIENSDYTHSDYFCEDLVEPNKKYYYLFRFLNEHRMPSHLSPILVSELIDDGGYKYALFDLLSEFAPTDVHTDPTQEFKKLFQIKPNVLQLSLNLDTIDYSQTAKEAVASLQVGQPDVDLVWGQNFKLRLVSKKTGKKVDLNINFNLHEDYLESDEIFSTTGLTTSEIEEVRYEESE